MDKYLMPISVLVIGCLGLAAYRYEVMPRGWGGQHVVVLDRWTGTVAICAPRPEGGAPCLPKLSAAHMMETAEEAWRVALERDMDALVRKTIAAERRE